MAQQQSLNSELSERIYCRLIKNIKIVNQMERFKNIQIVFKVFCHVVSFLCTILNPLPSHTHTHTRTHTHTHTHTHTGKLLARHQEYKFLKRTLHCKQADSSITQRNSTK